MRGGGYEYRRPMPSCSIPGCNGVYQAGGLCEKHYRRKWKHGDPCFVTHTNRWVLADCWTPDSVDQCWPWRGPSDRGIPKFRGRSAARVIYAQVRGPVGDDQILERSCSNSICINPWHMQPITRSESRARKNRTVHQ